MDQTSTLTIQQQPSTQVSAPGQEAMIPPAQQHPNKRKQVKNACTNCQKACKKCDDVRPCVRCVKYGLTETCVDSVRKERKKGVRRGPYKRKEKQNVVEEEATKTADQPSDVTSVSTPGPALAYCPPIPGPNGAPDYGYPANLNQYNFGPYNPAFYGSDKVPNTSPYMVYRYHPMMTSKDSQAPYPFATQMMIPACAFTQPQLAPRKVEDDTTLQETKHFTDQINMKENPMDPQPMTPVPSTSSSSLTSSSPDSNEEDDSSKFALLTQLCSAALKQGGTNVTPSE